MKIRRVDLYSDDALTGTTELADDEMGVYVRVWLLMYATGGPISIEKLKSVCLSHGTRLKNIINRLQTLGKVTINDQRITCKRCEKEIQRALNRLTKASQNGAKGGRPKDLEKPAGFTQNNPTSLQQPTKDSEANASARSDPVKELWDRGKALLRVSGMDEKKIGPLIGGWRKQFKDSAVMAAIVAAENEPASDPLTFIIGCLNHSKVNGNGTRAQQKLRSDLQAIVDADREEDFRGAGLFGSPH